MGFARVVTDYATFGYVSDVFVLESRRGRGLGKWLMERVMGHPRVRGLRKWLLATADAHGLYAVCGFTPLQSPESHMEILEVDLYVRDAE